MSVDQIVQLIQSAIQFGTVILFGAMGEILTEKSGNLNLGVPGIMYLGGIAGLAASFFYEFNNPDPSGFVCLVISLLAAFAASALGGLLYSFLTITLRANQNVTGLTLTIFGGGVANFFGGTLNSMAGGVGHHQRRVPGHHPRPVGPGASWAAAVQLWLHGISGHCAGRGAAAVPQPHPAGPEPAIRG